MKNRIYTTISIVGLIGIMCFVIYLVGNFIYFGVYEINEISNNNTNIDNTAEDKSNFDIGKILGILGSLNSGSENADFNLGNLDPKLFSKIQQIVISIGKKDPKKDLLISLKPFLRKSRQDKISEYITILTIIKAFEAFNDKGSDKNV